MLYLKDRLWSRVGFQGISKCWYVSEFGVKASLWPLGLKALVYKRKATQTAVRGEALGTIDPAVLRITAYIHNV